MKRKGVNVLTEAGKRQRTAVKEMREADCVYDRAAPYLLVTVRFPIDSLTSEWSIGVNRPIDQAHKRRLRQVFDEAGVLQRDASHRLQVACSKAQVQQMLDHLKEEGLAQTTATAAKSAEGDSKWPSFEGEPEKVLDRDNNKPALRKDLIPALRAKYSDKADEKSCVLKQRILNDVRTNANNFTSITLEHYLHEYPGADGDAYGARFRHKHKYLAGLMLGDTRTIRLPAIAQTARDLIYQIPEITNNPALQSTTAAEQLLAIMQPAIAQWISVQCLDVPDRYCEDRQPSIVRLAEERRVESKRNHTTIEGQPSAAVRTRMRLSRMLEGSDTHGSIKEPTTAPSPKRGSAVTSDAGASPRTEVQDRGLLDVTVTGLNTLRKQHRSKSAISQQRAQVHSASLTTDSHHAPNPSISLSSRTPAGSGHWRKSASARPRR
ncbi:hypothetical protein G6011_11833 [Alternaria panax]|uniref:Uncharacterized protein n=1 Tax=Alternaria panax TaxID=48097 RepID=A0AAD4F7X4_9PLEO|nr:hypothetical protein G6011_11833 [Alternaria panax]